MHQSQDPPRDLAGAGVDSSNGNGHQRNGHDRPATQSQVRALYAITRRQRADLMALVRERFGRERPEDLLLREASELIDELNGSTAGNGAQR